MTPREAAQAAEEALEALERTGEALEAAQRTHRAAVAAYAAASRVQWLSVPCPACAAPVKRACSWPGLPQAVGTHSERRRAAVEVGGLG